MPLVEGHSQKAVGKNIGKELRAGKPKRQAVAVALRVARQAHRKKKGGALPKRLRPKGTARKLKGGRRGD